MTSFSDNKLGIGINYRNEYANDILRSKSKLDFIEINTEKFFSGKLNDNLSKIISIYPTVLHGLSLSLGTINELVVSDQYVKNLQQSIKLSGCKWVSEHLAITRSDQHDLRALTPMKFDLVSANQVAEKIKFISKLISKPFLLENIAYYYVRPDNILSEQEFFKKVIELSECYILLDLNNLYVNSINHGYDPFYYLEALPYERIYEVHLAGCNYINGMLIDTHASSVNEHVLELFEYVCKKVNLKSVVIERDDNLDDFECLLEDVSKVRILYNKYKKRDL